MHWLYSLPGGVEAATWAELAALCATGVTTIWLVLRAAVEFQQQTQAVTALCEVQQEMRTELREVQQEMRTEMRTEVQQLRQELVNKLDILFASNVMQRLERLENRQERGWFG